MSATSNAHDDALVEHAVALRQGAEEMAEIRMVAEQTHHEVSVLRTSVAPQGQVETPFDGVLDVFRDLIREEKFGTALAQLTKRFGDGASVDELPRLALARARSLMGVCLRALNEPERAAHLFLEALELDGADDRVRSNAVVGYLLLERFDEAVDLARRLAEETPGSGRHGANLIYARKAAGHEGDPLDGLSVEARQTEEVRVAHVEALRARDDASWRPCARDVAARFPEAWEARRLAAEAVLEEALEVLGSTRPGPETITQAIAEVGQAAEALHAEWQRLTATERGVGPLELAVLHNAVVGYRLADRIEDAASLIEAEQARLADDEALRRLAAVVAIEAQRPALLELALAAPFDGDAVFHLEDALRREDWPRALEIVQTRREELVRPDHLDVGVLEGVLRAVMEPEPARAVAFDALLATTPPDPYADLVIAIHARRAGAEEAAEAAFRRGAAVDDLRHETRLRIAAEAGARSEHEVVIDLLEGHVDPTADRPERRWLAIAYASSEPPRAAGLAFFARAGRAAANADIVHRAAGHFHLNRRRPADAVPCFRRALKGEPRSARSHLALWKALARAGDARGAEALVQGIDLGTLEGEPVERLQVAQLMWQEGRGEVFEHAYHVAASHRDDPDASRAYAGLFLLDALAPRPLPFEEPLVVESGAWVRLERLPGEPLSFVVAEDRDDALGHRPIDDPIVREALGKAVGDHFETQDGPVRTTWRVAELKPKHLHLFHEITRTYNDRFPGRGGFWSVAMEEGDIAPVLEMAKERSAQARHLMETYEREPMTLGMAARLGGGTAVDFALHMARSGRKIVAATGVPGEEDRDAAAAHAARASGVVLDTYTAWLLATLDLLSVARALFARVVVPGSALDELDAMLGELAPSDQPRFALGYEDGAPVRIETPPEVVERQRAHLQGIRDAIAAAAEVVGTEAGQGLSDDALAVTSMIGTQADAAVVAQRERLALLSADLRMRQIAEALHKVPAFGMKGLLRAAVGEEALTAETRSRAVLELAEHGHAHIALDGPTLLSILDVDETPDLRRFAAAAAHLGTPDADPASHIGVASDFAALAWRRHEEALRAQRATGIVLRALVRLRGVPLHSVLREFVRRAGSRKVADYVYAWVRGHFLMDAYLASMAAERSAEEAEEAPAKARARPNDGG